MSDEQKLAHYEALRTYAAALEAERDALAAQVARVEALLSRWERLPGDWTFAGYAQRIRAALADPDPAPDGLHTGSESEDA